MHTGFDALDAMYNATSGEIGGFYKLHQFINGNLLVVDISQATVYNLVKVVRHHVGSHTHGNTRRTVDEQLWYTCRQYGWFLQRVIKIVSEVYRFFFNVFHHSLAQLLHTGFGITHCGRAIAILAAIVSLAINHHVAHAPWLRHSHHGIIYGSIAVRVVLTKYLTYYTRALLIWFVESISEFVHGEKHTAMHGL